ncbi:MAG: hypothetical protein V8R41_04490 [Dorea formicigenerans]
MRKMMKRTGAVVLSLAVAMSMLFSLAALPQMKVSAAGEMSRLKKWSLVAAMLGDDAYFTGKPTDETAAKYTAAEYFWNGEEKVLASDFCSQVKDYFAGEEDFDEAKLANIGENDFFSYDSATQEVTIKGVYGGYLLQCIELGQSEDGNDDDGVWVDPEEPNLKPYYTILEFNDDGAIVSYKKLSDEAVQFTFDVGLENEDGEVTNSLTTETNKVFIPKNCTAKFSYWITIKADEDKMPVQFTSDGVLGDIFALDLTSASPKIVSTEDDILSTEKTGSTQITYEVTSPGVTLFKQTVPCTCFELSVEGCDSPYGWINMLPKESMTLKANIKGYDSKKVTYMWDSRKYGIAKGGSTCPVKAPSSLGEGTVDISPCFDGESVEYSYEQAVNVRNCKLAVSINDMKTFKKATEPLKVGETYWLNLGGADWGWNYKNGSHTFYKIKLSQNGKTLNIDDNEKVLKSDFANIGIGAGGGVPNRILTPKKAGTLTITGTIYRNGKAFKTVTKKVNITNKVSVKMTTLSSVKNVKGKKMLVNGKRIHPEMVTRSSILQAVNLPKEIRQRQSVKIVQQAVRSVS